MVIAPALLNAEVIVDGGVPRRAAAQRLSQAVGNMLQSVRISIAFRVPIIDPEYCWR